MWGEWKKESLGGFQTIFDMLRQYAHWIRVSWVSLFTWLTIKIKICGERTARMKATTSRMSRATFEANKWLDQMGKKKQMTNRYVCAQQRCTYTQNT